MQKIDIMRNTGQNWAIIGGKVQRIEEIIPEPLVVEKKEKEELKEKLKEIDKGAKKI